MLKRTVTMVLIDEEGRVGTAAHANSDQLRVELESVAHVRRLAKLMREFAEFLESSE